MADVNKHHGSISFTKVPIIAAGDIWSPLVALQLYLIIPGAVATDRFFFCESDYSRGIFVGAGDVMSLENGTSGYR